MEDTLLIATAPAPVFNKLLLFCFIAALVLCSIGFKQLVWFMSVGYGFAVMGIGLLLLVYGIIHGANVVTMICCVLMIIYGFRLGAYLFLRETKNAAYRKTLASTGGTKKVPIFVSVFMWIYCAAMYAAQTSAVTYRLVNGDHLNWSVIAGAIIMALGVAGEALADSQKSAAKKLNPHRFCDIGLYKIVRCPNYFSEILVWTGVVVSGIGAVVGKQWIIVAIGYVLIVGVMISGAQRLEKRHEKSYGSDPEYIAYADRTPILFPLIPLYHLNKVEREKK
ncbi:MAG: DUF1295 domain-containing protein [Erysipelotrichaceae bacterium]|nr:DUF1295 domain-containing protein [Erysipelotrichaceae bacterium]